MIIIDNGICNTGSLYNMLTRVGVNVSVTSSPLSIASADGIVFPGVGAFDNAMECMIKSDLYSVLRQRVVEDKVPFLGICLGMQLLFNSSEEGELPGFGWIPGHVKRFDFDGLGNKHLKVPHMGWNSVQPSHSDSLFNGLEQDSRFYFVHSYHAVCSDASHALATTEYGYPFVSAVQKENIFGVQFHPEKSHRFGMALLRNFVEFVGC